MTSQCRSDLIFGLFWRMAFQSKLWFSARSHSCLESFPGSGSKARRRGPTSWCWRPWLTWPTWRCRCRWRRRRRSSTTTTSAGSRTTTSATTPCLKNKSLRLEKRKVTIRDELSPFQKVFVFPLLFFSSSVMGKGSSCCLVTRTPNQLAIWEVIGTFIESTKHRKKIDARFSTLMHWYNKT